MSNTKNQLNLQQEKAVKHTDGPLLIVAGAGTGKTTVITEKIAYLINQKKAKADEILALTFTDKAAGEMEERVDKILPYGYVDLWVMTFHSFCERMLKAHGLDIGIPNDFKLLNQTEQWLLVRENLDKFNLDYYRPLGNPTKFIHALIKHFSRCKDEEIWPANYIEYADKLKINQDSMKSTGGDDVNNETARLHEIADTYHIYQQLLLDNNSLDFGDLINYTLKLFRTRPHILKKYQTQFKYILVDEFQDTNWSQYELVKLLAGDVQNLTVVGDDDQSVYKFRGASVSNILQFKDDFPKSKEIYLNKNYRSAQNILDTAYNFIQLNNPERLEVKLAQLATGKNKLSKQLISQTKIKGSVEHLHFKTEENETTGIINKIIELKNNNQNCTWNDFAILVRANNQAESFLNALRSADLPHNFVASKGLYSKEVILDVLAYLKLLDNYHESLALWRILNLPMISLKIEDLMQINNFSKRKTNSLFETCEKINILNNIEDETKRKINKILKLVSEHTKLSRQQSVKKVILKFLQDFGYNAYLLTNNRQQDFIYLNQFGKKIDEFEKSFDDKSVKNFSRLIDLELEAGEQGSLSKESEQGPESIKIMTIHSAKGLEFKYVFIVNLVDKRFPSLERRDPIELPDELIKEIIPTGDVHLQEERRLFYVAMTRAKQGLFFSSAEDYGGSRKKKLSRFLYEIGMADEKINEVEKEKIKIKNVEKTDKTSINQQTLPTTFSFSQLKAFETCPYQYYLSFILKVPVSGKAVFSFGKSMHATLQKFFNLIKQGLNGNQAELFSKKTNSSIKPKEFPPLSALLELYEQSWIDDWFESKKQKQDYKKQGEDSLKNLYQQIKNNPPQVLENEKGFNFKIKNYTIRGVIDRIDKLDNGKIEIIDYKTGSAKTIKTVEKDQLLIYQMAAAQTFDKPVEQLTFYYLNENKPVSFLGTDKEITTQQEKMLSTIAEINKQNFGATPNQFKCMYCDFNKICQYKQ